MPRSKFRIVQFTVVYSEFCTLHDVQNTVALSTMLHYCTKYHFDGSHRVK